MAVLERSELEASPLADLHAIADQLGLEGFRRLRKAALIDAILGEEGEASPEGRDAAAAPDEGEDDGEREARPARPRRRTRLVRGRRSAAEEETSDRGSDRDDDAPEPQDEDGADEPTAPRRSGASRRGRSTSTSSPRSRGGRNGAGAQRRAEPEDVVEDGGRVVEGVVELLGNGSAFLRVSPPEPSDEDVYISAAQVRRCELISGDRVTGPVRLPRRSERYPSLVRVDTINGTPADEVSDGARYEDLPAQYATARLTLGSSDPTLEAIEWLTPLGRGSRAVIVGARGAGKSETLRKLVAALSGQEGLEITVALCGVRPEELGDWQEGPVAPAVALSFAASPDSQAQALERALDAAKRVAARGGDALVMIDSLDGLPPHAARKALAAARNLRDGGSLTVIASAREPLGGETTVIALDAALASSGRQPILDLVASATIRPELLVGEDGAAAITRARAAAMEAAV